MKGMKNHKKLIALVGSVSVLAGLTMSSASAADPVVLKLWVTTASDAAVAGYKTLASTFSAANPGITVDISYRSVDDHKTSLRQSSGTSAGPDLYFMWAGLGLGGEFVNAKMSQDLAAYYKQYNWASRFTPTVLSYATMYGGYNGVPLDSRTEAVYYNKTLFAKAGIKNPPRTYSELLSDATKLKRKGITPFEFGGTVNWHVMRLLDNLLETKCGSATTTALTSLKASWATTPCVTATFTEFKKWTTLYVNKSVMSIDQSQSSTLFFTSRAAMALEGDWFANQITGAKLDPKKYGVFAFPTGTKRIYGFGEMIYMNPASTHKDEAAKFLDFLSSVEGQKIISPALGGVSINKNFVAGVSTNLDADFVKANATHSGVFENNDQSFSLPITTEYWRIQNSVVTGGIKPASAGSQFQKFIDSQK